MNDDDLEEMPWHERRHWDDEYDWDAEREAQRDSE
jgi:hypothetical protein